MQMVSIFLTLVLLSASAWSQSVPTDPTNPGSPTYDYEVTEVKISTLRRKSVLFLPNRPEGETSPLVVFGHGQAAGVKAYDATLKHLAGKGIAALFVKYDSGFFDRKWRRMADNFNEITQDVLTTYSQNLNPNQVVFAGHSKGAYVALMAAGAPSAGDIHSLVLFAPAGYDQDYLTEIAPNVPVTIIWGEKDSIIDYEDQQEIFENLTVDYKQFITVKDYPDDEADHYFILNKKVFGFGENGISNYHYYGAFKWLTSAALDLTTDAKLTNPYLYGDLAGDSGDPNVQHGVVRAP